MAAVTQIEAAEVNPVTLTGLPETGAVALERCKISPAPKNPTLTAIP